MNCHDFNGPRRIASAMPRVQIFVGDVRDQLARLEPESVDCVVTSPPYWGLRDYGVDGQIGMERTLGEHLNVMVEVFNLVRRAMKPEATLWLNCGDCYATKPNGRSAAATKAAGNDDRTFRDKPFSTVGPVYGHLDREYEKTPRAGKTQNMGNLGAQSGPRIVGVGVLKPKDLCMIPNRLAIALQDAGWWVRSEIVWGKPNPMPDSSGRYRPSTAHEKVWLLSKSAKCFYDSDAVRMPSSSPPAEQQENGRLLRNYEPDLSPIVPPEVWNIATAAFSEAHFATFPPALVSPCIMAGCPIGGTVLDPFFGAGTTGLVAARLQRSCIGIELSDQYAEMAMRRIQRDSGLLAEVSLFDQVAADGALDLVRETLISTKETTHGQRRS